MTNMRILLFHFKSRQQSEYKNTTTGEKLAQLWKSYLIDSTGLKWMAQGDFALEIDAF